MNKTIIKYKYYIFCKNSIWVGPVLTLFYLAKELSYTQIFIIAAIYKLAVALLEVPTGAIADKIGHKKSVVFGLLIFALGLVMYPFHSHFLYFALCEVFMALGSAFVSGADESLFYDTLKEECLEKEYVKIMGKAQQYSFLTQMIGAIVSVILYNIYIPLPFFVSAVFMIIGVLIFASFKDIENSELRNDLSYIGQIKETGKYIYNHKKLRTIIIYMGLINMTAASTVYTYTPYFLAVGIDIIYFGFLFAIFNLTALITARYTDLFIKYTKPYSLIMTGVLLFVSYLLLGVTTVKVGVLAILFQQAFRGVNKTVAKKYINKCCPPDKRATILSYLSLSITLLGGVFGIILGIIIDKLNIFDAHLFLAGVVLLTILLINPSMKKHL